MAANPTSPREEAERLRRQRAVLAEFGLHALRTQDLDELLQESTELIAEACDIELVKIVELLPGGTDMLIRAGVHWDPGVVGHARLGADSHSPAGYALKTDLPVVSPDVDAETRFEIPELLRRHGVRSMVNVVIRGEGPPFGVLEIDSRAPRGFDQD